MTTSKMIFKLVPCSVFDIVGIEQWLEEMAQQGLILSRFVMGWVAVFEQQEPQNRRYRIATIENYSFILPEYDKPIQELKDYCQAFGWDYVVNYGEFFLFTTADETARELHSDHDVQAMALERIKKEKRHNLIIFLLLWLPQFVWAFIRDGAPLLGCIHIGTHVTLMLIALFVMLICLVLRKIIYLQKAQKHLQAGIAIAEQRNRKRYLITQMLLLLFMIASFGFLGLEYYADVNKLDEIPLEEYTGEIPTLMIHDLVSGGRYYATDRSEDANEISAKSDWLAPQVVQFNQRGVVVADGERLFEGSINVEYIEAKTPWLAQRLAKECHEKDWHLWGKRLEIYEPLALPNLDVDYAIAYKALLNHFILAKDCKVVYMYYHQSGGNEELTLDEISRMYADSLKE